MGIALSLLIGLLVLAAVAVSLRKPNEFKHLEGPSFRPYDEIMAGKTAPSVEATSASAYASLKEKRK
ncbi:hypothetical protein [Paenibacillus sp. FJAT-26967]|uniref:hypothetical protein n=1 Tax=Paenibacillus sp. FJAT-26967 TaxID=1729690 RepID=UPI00083985AC|nr:hypothetical protein [Paenibacillus sp. FJAT-26967]